MRRILFALVIGLGGTAILISLGLWQVRRLEWKEGIIAGIEARLAAEPVSLAALPSPDPARDAYQAVSLAGATTGQELLVLSGVKGQGAGYRVISAFETDGGRRILIDRGFVPETGRRAARPATPLAVTGNLMWPADADSFTPPPDRDEGLWFARDVPGMAGALGTEPVMVVLRAAEGDTQGVQPQPVGTQGIPNDHFGYAVTWFSLAAVWAGMTVFFLWRIRRRTT